MCDSRRILSAVSRKESAVSRKESAGCGKTPQGRGKSPQSRGKSPQSRGKSPQGCGKSPQGCGKSPQSRGKNPQSCGKNPQSCGKSPQGCGKVPTAESTKKIRQVLNEINKRQRAKVSTNNRLSSLQSRFAYCRRAFFFLTLKTYVQTLYAQTGKVFCDAR